MSAIKVEDGAGSSLTLYDVDGYTLALFQDTPEKMATLFRSLKNLKCREDDVFICTPLKSGTNWTWEIVSMLLQGQAETIPKLKVSQMVEAVMPNTLEEVPSPRVLNSHVHFHKLPDGIKEKRCKVIFVLRNIKDVAVSFWHHCSGFNTYHYKGSFANFLPMFLDGKLEYNSWFDYVLEWERVKEENPDIPILVLYYEDMKEDLLRETKRIASFLGVNDTLLVENVAKKCSFENMAEDKKASEEPLRNLGIIGDDFSFFRKGKVGDWKNYFTEAQNEMIDKFYKNKMKASKLKFRYTL